MKIDTIKKIDVSVLRAPLIQPFRTALGEHKELENLLFTIEFDSGIKGYGEAAIATHITGETLETTRENLLSIGGDITGKDPRVCIGMSKIFHKKFEHNKAAVCAIEMALLDGLGKRAKMPLWRMFGDGGIKLATDITIVISSIEETEETAEKYYGKGFRSFKVKVGRDEKLDLKRVVAVKRIAPGAKIIVDANQGYTASQALNFLKALEKEGARPDLIEQPVPKEDWEGLKKVTRLSEVPVCADESCKSLTDCLRIIEEKAAHAINIKFTKSGVIQAREIAIMSRAAGLDLMIGGMMETSLCMTAAAHLAVGLGAFKYVDLDTPFFIKGAVDKNPYLSRHGIYDVEDASFGIGLSIDQIL
jgi:L-alanine-DL-glutamate epimerase-like enolase superfamily enzyme